MDESAAEAELGSNPSIFADEQQHVLRRLRALPPQQRMVVALS
jgi:hypothetical protein